MLPRMNDFFFEITAIICLISDIEIRSIGGNVKKYQEACASNGITLFQYPMVEMTAPKEFSKWNEQVVLKAVNHIL